MASDLVCWSVLVDDPAVHRSIGEWSVCDPKYRYIKQTLTHSRRVTGKNKAEHLPLVKKAQVEKLIQHEDKDKALSMKNWYIIAQYIESILGTRINCAHWLFDQTWE